MRFNFPDEVAIVAVGESLQIRGIVLHRRNNQLQRVSTYDTLQYPILFGQDEDGYHSQTIWLVHL